MSTDIDSFQDYRKEVQRNALISLEEVEDELEQNEREFEEDHIIISAIEQEMEGSHMIMYNSRSVINYTDQGFYDHGYEIYLHHAEFEENDPRDMIRAIAQAAYYNDLENVLQEIFDCRESLGEAMILLDGALLSKGYEVEYIFTKNTLPDEYHFKLEHLGEGEWRMYDHHGDSFEVISPDVYIKQSDRIIPEKSLNIWLDNICYRRLHELEE